MHKTVQAESHVIVQRVAPISQDALQRGKVSLALNLSGETSLALNLYGEKVSLQEG
jgi:hypothetical protein